MAQFHVGQRVRITGSQNELLKPYIGMEATIVAEREWRGLAAWELDIDPPPYVAWAAFASYHLAPLTDPSAERFIESIKKLGREPINDAPKVEVTK